MAVPLLWKICNRIRYGSLQWQPTARKLAESSAKRQKHDPMVDHEQNITLGHVEQYTTLISVLLFIYENKFCKVGKF